MPTIRMTTRSSTSVKPSSREARERSVDSMFPPRETCLYGSPAPGPRRQPGFLRAAPGGPWLCVPPSRTACPYVLALTPVLSPDDAPDLRGSRANGRFFAASPARLFNTMARQLAIWAAVLFAIGLIAAAIAPQQSSTPA